MFLKKKNDIMKDDGCRKKNICVLVCDYYGHGFSNLDFLYLFFCKLLKLLILYL